MEVAKGNCQNGGQNGVPGNNLDEGIPLTRLRRQYTYSLSIEADNVSKRDNSISISFQELSLTVRYGLRRATKEILKNLHGHFKSGELTAIMGPSGAGKSSLMNILSGYTTSGVTGKILVNGEEREMRTFCRQSCYILQEDVLPRMLTVHEAMVVAGKLKLGLSEIEAESRISEILDTLGLNVCRSTLTSNLSGGQKKLLSMAMELVNDPPVMFFDEPTSGLDSSMSKHCLRLLKGLAETGRTIICTIHQPSATLFELFDHVYVVSNGQCLYSGEPGSLVSFLEEQQIPCPQYHNPADFLLEMVSMEEYECYLPRLFDAMRNRKDYRRNKDLSLIEENKDAANCSEETSLHRKISLLPKKVCQKSCRYKASFWTQFSTIIVRNFLNIIRDKNFILCRLFTHITLGLLIGCIYYDIGNRAKSAYDNFSMIFFSIMIISYTSYASAVMYYPKEYPLLAREHFNKWYSLKTYFIASNLSDAPIQVLCPTIYFGIVYFMSSQPLHAQRFAISWATLIFVGFVGESIGYLVGCSMKVTNASIFGPFCLCPFMIFSGFFVLISDSPFYLKWIFDLSFYKYALHASMNAIFGFERPKMYCNEDFCNFQVPGRFLKYVGLEKGSFIIDWAYLSTIILLLRVLTYGSLFIHIRYLRK